MDNNTLERIATALELIASCLDAREYRSFTDAMSSYRDYQKDVAKMEAEDAAGVADKFDGVFEDDKRAKRIETYKSMMQDYRLSYPGIEDEVAEAVARGELS